MNFRRSPLRRTTGFTLVELMTGVTIVGVLASMSVPAFVDAVNKSKRVEVVVNVDGISTFELAALVALDRVVETDEMPRSLGSSIGDKALTAWPEEAGTGWDELGWEPDGAVRGTYRVVATTNSAGVETWCVVGASNVDGNETVEMVWQRGGSTPSTTEPCDGGGGSYAGSASSGSSTSTDSSGSSTSTDSSGSASSGSASSTDSSGSASSTDSSGSASSTDSSGSESSGSSTSTDTSTSTDSTTSTDTATTEDTTTTEESSSGGSGKGKGKGAGSAKGKGKALGLFK